MVTLVVFLSLVVIVLLASLIWILQKRQGENIPQDLIKSMQDLGAVKSLLDIVEANQRQFAQGLENVKGDLNRRTLEQNQIIQEIKDIVGTGSRVQDDLHRHIEQTLTVVENIKTDYQSSKRFQEINRESLERIEGIIAGTKTKGIAGENILKEILSIFPPEMVTTKFKIKGKEVEFGLVLSDRTVVPIDVKWPSTVLLEEFSKESDEQNKNRIVNLIEKDVNKRISEVAQYIEAGTTAPWAVCAIPDSAYQICKDTHIDAYKKNVILISYSMALPYLLTFFSLHMQYSGNVDIENLERYLIDIKRHLTQMADILENKIQRSITVLENASGEYREIIGSLKGSVRAIESQGPKKNTENKEMTV